MQVRLLGSVEIVASDIRPVPGRRRKAVLAALALNPGRAVSTEKLIEIVWDAGAPVTAAGTLQNHISFLRRLIGERSAIKARPPGYVLEVDGEATDVQVAQRLIREGTRSEEPSQRLRRLRAAIELWRGPALHDIVGLPWFEDQARELDLLLVRARRASAETLVAVGQHDQAIPALEGLCRDHPLDEPLHELLMFALYRAGRQADALAVCRALRCRLGDELGIDPGPAVRSLETAILRQDPDLDRIPADVGSVALTAPNGTAAAASLRPAAVSTTPPAQLPPDLASFAGRCDELRRLDGLLANGAAPGRTNPGPVVISAVAGTAGVGKTALAVHWAHRVTPQFPDGQLYVNLRGFTAGVTPTDPTDAVHLFLTAFGVPADQIPAGLEARSGLYRSLLAGKRVLVLLDNARDVEQVHPLLPGAPGCLALITSRNQLTPLVATAGAVPLEVDLLTPADAHTVMEHRIGAERAAAEPSMVADIVARCEGLPLAIALAAARVATKPRLPLAAFAAELRASVRQRASTALLDLLDGGDADTDLRGVFSWSYRALSRGAARLYRLLSLRPGPTITLPAAASLAGVPRRRLAPLVTELTRASLLSEHTPNRYSAHDLLCMYAWEQAQVHDSEDERNAAVRRLLDHYLHTAQAGARLLDPSRPAIPLIDPLPGVQPEVPRTAAEAVDWFTAERTELIAATHRAFHDGGGLDAHAWQLAAVLEVYLSRQHHWRDLAAISTSALRSAQRLDDETGMSHALRGMLLAADGGAPGPA
jgi:DNA-binding SARP family transcriptional activator